MDFRTIWKTPFSKPLDKIAVRSLCYKPDYSQLIASYSNDLFFLSPDTGDIIEQKRAHHATIYCVKCSPDGTFFASCDSDGKVVIWRSLNNEGYVSYGSSNSATALEWCPSRQLLISVAKKEYRIWKPEDTAAAPVEVQFPILSIAFSPAGDTFVLSFDNGLLHVVSVENQEVLQTFNYSSIVTTMKFSTIDKKDYLVTSDLDCRVSMYRISDKTLVGKNSIPFEALCCSSVGDSTFFFAFAGISGKVSLLTSSLSYLGDFQSGSDWIWDIAVDKRGRVAIATKEGYVELRSIDFGIAFASAGDVVAYRNSVNSMVIKNIINGNTKDMSFNKIIASTTMSSNFILVQFKDSVITYKYSIDNEHEGQLIVEKINEIPGNFEKSLFAITRIHIISAEGNQLAFYDLTGCRLPGFSFSAPITSLRTTSAYNDGVIIGCADCRVYFVMMEMKEPVLLARHSSPVADAIRSGLIVTVRGKNGECGIYDSFERKTISMLENVHSMAYSDRVEGLLATSNGTEVTIHFRDCKPITQFIEGDILAFVRNKVILTNEGALETIDAPLPIKELIEREDWDAIKRLCDLGPSEDQLTLIAKEAIKAKKFDVAKLISPDISKSMSFFVNEVLPTTPRENINDTIAIFLGDENYSKKKKASRQSDAEPDSPASQNPAKYRAIELEKAGAQEEALNAYAECGEWDDVFRLAEEKHLERAIVDYSFPEEHTEKAAKVLLKAGLGEGAIRLLTRSQNHENLAKARVYLGQWVEAISLSRLYASVYNIVYPRFGELLFESGRFFESLVCFFIPEKHDDRSAALTKMVECASISKAFDQLSFLFLMHAFNDSDSYWRVFQRSTAYLTAQRLRNMTLLPMSLEDSKLIFLMSYYLLACIAEFPLLGVNVLDVLVQLLVSSSALGMKKWLTYALKEISAFKLDEKTKQISQRAARASREAQEDQQITFPCPRCKKDIFSSAKMPILCCGNCGMRLAFSAHSCRPLPLVAFTFTPTPKETREAEELISIEPGIAVNSEIPADNVSERFLTEQPAEAFVVQSLKKKAGVKPQLWYNQELACIHVCSTCGVMLDDEDFEQTTMSNEYCPVCRTALIEGAKSEDIHNEILEMLRPFEDESPVSF